MKNKLLLAGCWAFILSVLIASYIEVDGKSFKEYTGTCQLITEKSPSTNTIYGGRCEYETKAGDKVWENIYVIGFCRLGKQCVLDAIDRVRHNQELNKVEITYEDI